MLSLLIALPFVSALCMFLPVAGRFRRQVLLAVSLVHGLAIASFWRGLPPSEWNGFLAVDDMSLLLLTILSGLYLFVAVFMIGYFENEKRSDRTLVVCLLALLATMTLSAVSRHLGLLWVAVETSTLFSAPLIGFHRNRESLEATWKYLLVCSVGIALALMGTFFLAIAAHDTHSLLLPDILAHASTLSHDWLKLSVIFLLVGYGCKMGLAPTHSWKPDAYSQAPGMVVVLMAGAVTQCSFLALMRVGQICGKAGLGEFYSSILILSGALSLAVPAAMILGERNIKRAFAYSSVEHMGLLVLGLGLGGIGVTGAFFHMINNALAKVVMFLTAGSVDQKYGHCGVGEVRGVIHTYPVTGALLLVALFAGTGMFPFATFHSELMILNAAVTPKYYALAVFCVICLAIIFVGIARIVLDVVHGKPTEPVLPKKENLVMNVPIIIAAVFMIVLGLWIPSRLETLLAGLHGTF